MGGLQSSCRRIVNLVRSNDPVLNIRISGLPGSGKKSIINYISHGKTALSRDTFEEREINWIVYNGYKLILWTGERDLAKSIDEEDGDEQTRSALIYVIDGSDEKNFLKAKEGLQNELRRYRTTPELLVLMNKCDVPTFGSVVEMYNFLELEKITDGHVHIQQTSAITGEGIKESLYWLCRRFEVKNGRYLSRRGKS